MRFGGLFLVQLRAGGVISVAAADGDGPPRAIEAEGGDDGADLAGAGLGIDEAEVDIEAGPGPPDRRRIGEQGAAPVAVDGAPRGTGPGRGGRRDGLARTAARRAPPGPAGPR